MATRVVTAHLPAELAKKLDGLAGHLDRPRGWLVKEAIEAYVGLAEERRRETLEALREVAAGQVVEHDEVEAWASALKTGSRGSSHGAGDYRPSPTDSAPATAWRVRAGFRRP